MYHIGRDPSCFGNVYFNDKLIIRSNGSGISSELNDLIKNANKWLEAEKNYGDKSRNSIL